MKECRNKRKLGRKKKLAFDTEEEARDYPVFKSVKRVKIYYCDKCGKYHYSMSRGPYGNTITNEEGAATDKI